MLLGATNKKRESIHVVPHDRSRVYYYVNELSQVKKPISMKGVNHFKYRFNVRQDWYRIHVKDKSSMLYDDICSRSLLYAKNDHTHTHARTVFI